MSEQLMRPGLPDEYGIVPLQNRILGIMMYIDNLCRENGIEYCLMGGSALGAKRHGGFIPWDDDLDIFMAPDSYEKFRDVFNKKGDRDKYYLQEWGNIDGLVIMSKIRMNDTTYIEENLKDWDMHHGIYVDIFIMHVCPDSTLLQIHQFIWAKYLVLKGLGNRGYSKRKGLTGFVLKLMRLLPRRFLLKHALKQVYKYRNRKTRYYCNFLGRAMFKKGIYKREWMDNPLYVPFETVMLKVPGNLEAFLTDRFGDYMTIPSPERIKWEQHAWKWDIYKDFREYVKNTGGYKDEINLV